MKGQPEIEREKVKQLITAIGGLAEMAHTFYIAMIQQGADRTEATAGMQGFILAFWHEANNQQRQQQTDQEE